MGEIRKIAAILVSDVVAGTADSPGRTRIAPFRGFPDCGVLRVRGPVANRDSETNDSRPSRSLRPGLAIPGKGLDQRVEVGRALPLRRMAGAGDGLHDAAPQGRHRHGSEVAAIDQLF